MWHFFDILVTQVWKCHTYLYNLGSLLLNIGSESRNSFPTWNNHSLFFSYLCNYQDFTSFNTFMFMYVNIYWEIDQSIKKESHSGSLISSGCLWRGYFTNTHTTNQRDVTPFYIIGQHGEEKNEMEFVNFITQGDKLICGWWCAAPKWDLLHPQNCVKCLKREGSFHTPDRLIGFPEEVRLETYKSTIVCRQ